ncbi:MAG: CRISPR-associated helicase Cas3' [Candidatus Hatepunaea meridiana]|nr:CRISPR-associated helicase Cas3' [Candidatus Hatepunaea meridiana]
MNAENTTVRNKVDWKLLWAKTDRKGNNDRYHPLICHMLDVAAVFGLVWDNYLSSSFRKRLTSAFKDVDVRTLLVFVAGAHDIGKANPGFQRKNTDLSNLLELPFSDNDQNHPHGFISASVLKDFLGSSEVSALLGQITGGHHGVFPRCMELRMGVDKLGNKKWTTARQDLLEIFANTVGFDFNRDCKFAEEIEDPFIVSVLAGFISVVDWIGSNQDFFPCAAERGKAIKISDTEYWRKAQEQAQQALEKLGWSPFVSFAEETRFGTVFTGFTANSLQTTAIELTSKQTSSYLMIVEAPMGQGKTEAAFYAADLAMCRGFARGMYVAMPTQATGNAMFKRVLDDYLKQRGHKGKLNLQLVHGNALLTQLAEVPEGEIPNYEPKSIGDDGDDTEAQSWFTAKKRPLLAPFGVGTIDQSLLSVLQTKHWFVRQFGLAGKVVIFDEVHAYDAYMSTILERLLHWLAELDCTVILLSATLPEEKRKALTRAYSGQDNSEYKRYPRITLAKPRHYLSVQANEASVCKEIPMGKSRPVSLEFGRTDLDSLTTTLTLRLEHGGCAAVICNTVNRSIEVFKHLQDNLIKTECLLFHARTLQMWRHDREKDVLRKFGKGEKQADGNYLNQNRPARAVLVATQVIEQSLDLDFDLMVSEIAPVDLLLQRLGRLHRHQRERQQGLESPQFIVLCDAEKAGPSLESFGKSIEFIYDRYILLRTWLTLRERDKIEIPTEIEELVESVYGTEGSEGDDSWIKALREARTDMESKHSESEKSACRLLVSKPKDPSDLIEQFNDQLADDENPEDHKSVRAATREGDPSITIVMLPADMVLANEPKIPEVRKLLDRSTKISHRGVFCAMLSEGELPKQWSKDAHLRHIRCLRLDEQGIGRIKNYKIKVNRKLGIEIEKEDKNNV